MQFEDSKIHKNQIFIEKFKIQKSKCMYAHIVHYYYYLYYLQ